MSKLFIFFLLTFSTDLIFGQANELKQTTATQPFVLGVIEAIE